MGYIVPNFACCFIDIQCSWHGNYSFFSYQPDMKSSNVLHFQTPQFHSKAPNLMWRRMCCPDIEWHLMLHRRVGHFHHFFLSGEGAGVNPWFQAWCVKWLKMGDKKNRVKWLKFVTWPLSSCLKKAWTLTTSQGLMLYCRLGEVDWWW